KIPMENQPSPPPVPPPLTSSSPPPLPPPRKRTWLRNLLILAGLIGVWIAFYETKTPTQDDTSTKIAGNASAPAQQSAPGSEKKPVTESEKSAPAKPATSNLKLSGTVTFRQPTHGCIDINDTFAAVAASKGGPWSPANPARGGDCVTADSGRRW